jgi:uncharacterized protein with PIN domain
MTKLIPDERCDKCDGPLVPPEIAPMGRRSTSDLERPDYVCLLCRRGFYWRGNPPRLVVGLPAE